MSPLHIFLKIAQLLVQKPINFWLPAEKQDILRKLGASIVKLEKILENKKLTNTHAYAQLKALEKTVTDTELKEVNFIQILNNLVDIYKHSPADKTTAELILRMDAAVSKAKPRILEYYLSLEHLSEKAKKLSDTDREKRDLETMQKVGVFYVLEYTLQVLAEFTHLSDVDKIKLLKEGLKTEAGNLPAYYLIEDSMRKELCYNIFNEQLRNELLAIFYKFEEVCYNTGELPKIGFALQQFNLAILKTFQKKGLQIFKGTVYSPFGNNIPMVVIIKKVEQTN